MSKLQRTTFKTSRAAQYVEARALTSMTGQAIGKFADVVTKELMDNALDACETAGVAPEINLSVEGCDDKSVAITVSDNAGGIPSETVHGALDFSVLVSDKAAYRSPTRGAQGNALKTVFGIPHALGSLEPVVVESKGMRHEARVWKDQAGELRVQCDDTDLSEPRSGTAITAHVPLRGRSARPAYWARAFSLFNPHAKIRIRQFDGGVNLVNPPRPITKILTFRPVMPPSASSTCPAIRRARTGTTRGPSGASSTATSGTTATMAATTCTFEPSSGSSRGSRPPARPRPYATTSRRSRCSRTSGSTTPMRSRCCST